MQRTECLKLAEEAVSKDREEEYGPPEVNLQCTADLWSTYLKHTVTAEDVAILNILQKISRTACGPVGPDTYIDMAGYAALAGELADDQR